MYSQAGKTAGQMSGFGYGRGGVGPGQGPGVSAGGVTTNVTSPTVVSSRTMAAMQAAAKAKGGPGDALGQFLAFLALNMPGIPGISTMATVGKAINALNASLYGGETYSPMAHLAQFAPATAKTVSSALSSLGVPSTQSLASGLGSLVGNGLGQSSGTTVGGPQGGLGSLSGAVTGHTPTSIIQEAPVFSPAPVPSQPRSSLQPAFQLSEAALNPFLISPGSATLQSSIF